MLEPRLFNRQNIIEDSMSNMYSATTPLMVIIVFKPNQSVCMVSAIERSSICRIYYFFYVRNLPTRTLEMTIQVSEGL